MTTIAFLIFVAIVTAIGLQWPSMVVALEQPILKADRRQQQDAIASVTIYLACLVSTLWFFSEETSAPETWLPLAVTAALLLAIAVGTQWLLLAKSENWSRFQWFVSWTTLVGWGVGFVVAAAAMGVMVDSKTTELATALLFLVTSAVLTAKLLLGGWKNEDKLWRAILLSTIFSLAAMAVVATELELVAFIVFFGALAFDVVRIYALPVLDYLKEYRAHKAFLAASLVFKVLLAIVIAFYS